MRIEIIYVSSDRDPDEFQKNFGGMPWKAVESQQYKDIISRKCKIRGIPTLIVLNAENGYFITDQTRDDIMNVKGDKAKGKALIEKWKSMKAVPLEEATFSNPACVIL